MARSKHIPVRTCVGCRTQKPKRELLRIVRSPAGEVTIDSDGKAAGRGAYLCPTESCIQRAWKAKSLSHSLKCEIPDGLWARLSKSTPSGTAAGDACFDQVSGSDSPPS